MKSFNLTLTSGFALMFMAIFYTTLLQSLPILNFWKLSLVSSSMFTSNLGTVHEII